MTTIFITRDTMRFTLYSMTERTPSLARSPSPSRRLFIPCHSHPALSPIPRHQCTRGHYSFQWSYLVPERVRTYTLASDGLWSWFVSCLVLNMVKSWVRQVYGSRKMRTNMRWVRKKIENTCFKSTIIVKEPNGVRNFMLIDCTLHNTIRVQRFKVPFERLKCYFFFRNIWRGLVPVLFLFVAHEKH